MVLNDFICSKLKKPKRMIWKKLLAIVCNILMTLGKKTNGYCLQTGQISTIHMSGLILDKIQ